VFIFLLCFFIKLCVQLLNLGKLSYIEIAWRSWKAWAVETLKRILDTLTAVPSIFWSVLNVTLMKLVHVKLEVLMTVTMKVWHCVAQWIGTNI
jgi:hypothetical protein